MNNNLYISVHEAVVEFSLTPTKQLADLKIQQNLFKELYILLHGPLNEKRLARFAKGLHLCLEAGISPSHIRVNKKLGYCELVSEGLPPLVVGEQGVDFNLGSNNGVLSVSNALCLREKINWNDLTSS